MYFFHHNRFVLLLALAIGLVGLSTAQADINYPARIDLRSLPAEGRILIEGRQGSYFGNQISIGDINGDGVEDIAIGAINEDASSPNTGALYVIFGGSTLKNGLDLSSLDGSNGFVIRGAASRDFLGDDVAVVGDINGDGIDDLVVTAVNAGGTSSGTAYVVFGRQTWPAVFDLATLNGTTGFKVVGENAGDELINAASAGDVNNDGIADLILASPRYDLNSQLDFDEGMVYVVFGKSNFPATFDLATLNGSNGFRVPGVQEDSFLGWAIAGGGDINGDNVDDIVFSSLGSGQRPKGATYVIYGGQSFPASFQTSTLNGSNGFKIPGIFDEADFGYSVSFAGDVNGDGIDDLIIGQQGTIYNATVNPSALGAAYVIFGNQNLPASFDLSALNGSNGFKVSASQGREILGVYVTSVGDFNGDGLGDVVVGSPSVESTDTASLYMIYGREDFPATVDVDTLNGRNGFEVIVGSSFDQSPVATGNIFGTGNNALAIGHPATASNPADGPAEVYILFTPWPNLAQPIPFISGAWLAVLALLLALVAWTQARRVVTR